MDVGLASSLVRFLNRVLVALVNRGVTPTLKTRLSLQPNCLVIRRTKRDAYRQSTGTLKQKLGTRTR